MGGLHSAAVGREQHLHIVRAGGRPARRRKPSFGRIVRFTETWQLLDAPEQPEIPRNGPGCGSPQRNRQASNRASGLARRHLRGARFPPVGAFADGHDGAGLYLGGIRLASHPVCIHPIRFRPANHDRRYGSGGRGSRQPRFPGQHQRQLRVAAFREERAHRRCPGQGSASQ